jgi:hypothetical protein
MSAVDQLTPTVGAAAVGRALGMARAAWSRRPRPAAAPHPRPTPARALSAPERPGVVDTLHGPRFADQTPAEVYATLLDEGTDRCSIRIPAGELTLHADRGTSMTSKPVALLLADRGGILLGDDTGTSHLPQGGVGETIAYVASLRRAITISGTTDHDPPDDAIMIAGIRTGRDTLPVRHARAGFSPTGLIRHARRTADKSLNVRRLEPSGRSGVG